MRKSYTSGAKWEDIVAYRRAVRIDNNIEVSGTTAMVDGKLIGKNDPYEQTLCCLEIILKAIENLGGKPSDIIRTRIFVTDINQWEEIGRAHHDMFKDCPPVTTMVEVARLIDDNLLVEIEASAVVGNGE